VQEGLSKADIESLLRHRRWLEPVPTALVARHRLQRQREFARLVIVWWPLLVCAFLAFVAFTAWHYHHAFTPHDLRLLALTELLCLALGLLGVVWGFQPHRLPGHERWLPWLFGLILAVRLASSLLLHSEALAVNAVHMALLVCVVGALGLHLGLRAVLLGCALGLLGWLSLPWSPRADMAALTLGHYLLTVLVCVFVAAVRQDKDRMAFYQSVLLELERQDVQRLNTELAEQARQDSLTRLANRRAFDEALDREWERARRQAQPLALLMIDVDHFKAYNDHLGHPAGDACLTRLAAALLAVVRRAGDVAARYGGEEFVMLMPDTDEAGAQAMAQRLMDEIDALALPHPASSVAPHVTVSMGVAVARPRSGDERQTLVDQADAALYQAKHGGRHRQVLYVPAS
jgi:diguanylate cyclase (GGDEF)-like protein